MEVVFADTFYWQALIDTRDNHHKQANELGDYLFGQQVIIVTSEMVLTEVLNALGNLQPGREQAIRLVRNLKSNPNVEIVSNSECPFDDGFELYVN
jgi:predicted nucleic acid-binding protein